MSGRWRVAGRVFFAAIAVLAVSAAVFGAVIAATTNDRNQLVRVVVLECIVLLMLGICAFGWAELRRPLQVNR